MKYLCYSTLLALLAPLSVSAQERMNVTTEDNTIHRF